MTTQAWHRVCGRAIISPKAVGSGAAGGSTAIEAAGNRVFDSKRADYVSSASIPTMRRLSKNVHTWITRGRGRNFCFLKAMPSARFRRVSKKIACNEYGHDIVLELGKRGITADTKLLKIGEDEYAELWHQRGLKDHIDSAQLRRETAKDAVQYRPLKGTSFAGSPLAEPIRIDAAGKLTGDVAGLSSKGLYKLGDDHLVHIVPDFVFG